MIEYLENRDVNKRLWDGCISEATNGIVYAFSWYLDIVAPNWSALVLGNYDYVFPIVQGKKVGIKYIYPPFFIQHLEVYGKNPSLNLLEDFLNHIPKKFKYIEMNVAGWSIKKLDGFKLKSRINIELHKPLTNPEIVRNFSKNHRRNITKALKNNVSVKKDDNFIKTINLFEKNKGIDIGFKAKHYAMLRRLMKEILSRKTGIHYSVLMENEVIGGAFFTLSHQRMIFLFSGLSEIGRNLGAMHLLISKVISENYPKFEMFDFEGSNDQNLARFYLGFGGKSLEYHTIIKNDLPWYISWLK